VIVVNADKVRVTEKTQKLYRRHSAPRRYEDGNVCNCKRLPERIVEQAVKGMLPKIAWGGNCSPKVYAGIDHPTKPKTSRVKITIPGDLNNASSRYQRRSRHVQGTGRRLQYGYA